MKIQIDKTGNETEIIYWRLEDYSNPFRKNTEIEELTDNELKEIIHILHSEATKLDNKLLRKQKNDQMHK